LQVSKKPPKKTGAFYLNAKKSVKMVLRAQPAAFMGQPETQDVQHYSRNRTLVLTLFVVYLQVAQAKRTNRYHLSGNLVVCANKSYQVARTFLQETSMERTKNGVYVSTHAMPWLELGLSEETTPEWVHGPRKKVARILERASQVVQETPYKVTVRFVFYVLWQEGYFHFFHGTAKQKPKAQAYHEFDRYTAKLRRSPQEIQDRFPMEFADNRRDPLMRTNWIMSGNDWIRRLQKGLVCKIDKMTNQDCYVTVAFEAEAMLSQFEYVTEPYGVSLWPFSGHASVSYLKRIASFINIVNELTGKPVMVLYFGDYDPAGEIIPETAFRHVRKWVNTPFSAYRVGLNLDQVERYGIEEDPDRPGKFQWEAVSAGAAEEIITGALDQVIDMDKIEEIEHEEIDAVEAVQEALEDIELDGQN
jgi:hypothetical protein